MDGASSSHSGLGGATPPQGINKLNDAVWELHNPGGDPKAEIIFFHGLQVGDYRNAFWETWLARSDKSLVWPKHWLGEKAFPNARILSVSYDSSAQKNDGQLDMFRLGENLVSDVIVNRFDIGQKCPIIIVGHCLGGIILKQFFLSALSASEEKARKFRSDIEKIDKFLGNIKGVFYYATPHGGFNTTINVANWIGGCNIAPNWAKWMFSCIAANWMLRCIGAERMLSGSDFLQFLTTDGKERERINEEFRKARENRNATAYSIAAYSIAESLHTNYLDINAIVVNEVSARRDSDDYYTAVNSNHFNVCRPENETSGSFQKLRDFIANILNEVQEQRCRNSQLTPKGTVGLDCIMTEVEQKLLENQIVGIYGMGGKGKTTAAKALFSKFKPTFEYSCFVSDVKLIAGEVETEVWNCMHHWGKKFKGMSSQLQGRRLLLVLDDVDNDADLDVISNIMSGVALENWGIVNGVAPESWWIVTSQDKELVSSFGLDLYEMPFLSDEDAKKVFISHAFPGKVAAPAGVLEKHVEAIVKKCGGLPLTLEVIGKYLKSKIKNEKIWEETLEALDSAEQGVANFDEKLWKKLRVSYDNLGEKEQQMFLDAVTFFSDVEADPAEKTDSLTLWEAKAAWGAIYGKAQIRWRTLVDFSLVYDGSDDDMITTHEQLLSMGRRIALECKDGQRKSWNADDRLASLRCTNDLILSLRFHRLGRRRNTELDVPMSFLGRLQELRYLDVHRSIQRITIEGAEENQTLPTKNLGFLQCGSLQIFNPAHCPCLAVLILSNCSDPPLKELPSSFGQLYALKILTIVETYELEILPAEFGNLSQLERLTIVQCNNLRTLPETFGGLSRLEYLRLHCKRLDNLPDSIGQLAALKRLSLYNCYSLCTLPESFGHLSALERLSLKFCSKLKTLPSQRCFGQLAKLQILKMVSCPNIDSLPFSTEHMPVALRHLYIAAIGLVKIPDCIKNFPSLEILELGKLNLEEVPPWLTLTPRWPSTVRFLIKLIDSWFLRFHVQDGNFTIKG